MKALGAVAIVTLMLVPHSASAESRGTDAALGAVSGALVFGPVGAVAGAVVGFTAGPAISRSWGTNGGSRSRARAHMGSREMQSRGNPDPAVSGVAAQSDPQSSPAAPMSNAASSAQAKMPSAAAVPPAHGKPPPVQGLE